MSSRKARPSTRTRSESKELTRKALLRAALKLLSRNSFDSISLRTVTREAGISPTAFYRHFDDMEELGLELVEESFGSLHAMMREARADPAMVENAVDASVDTMVLAARRDTDHYRFIARERYGGVRRIRRSIRSQLSLFADELAVDLSGFPVTGSWSVDDRRMLAGLIVETMIHMTAELVDADPDEAELLVERTRSQLRLIVFGAAAWASVPPELEQLVEDHMPGSAR